MWISFVSDLNPGAGWPQFSLSATGRQVLQLQNGNVTAIADDFHLEETQYLNSARLLNEFEK
ncbi:hypothetical protein EXIGLDRAFT_411394 [Exidia glandulosa HHB12029]|uniref:Uncharacterized protein n=1 Tax=Exidia glandulosa HHB12029 TaxID=1314781 RepID=A0A165KPC3_EXIGL|nr:hypothetical protein EXIGLDRAFT_411394 [Exidia glandulosa HHB12029]